MDFDTIALFAITEFLLTLAPGPATVLVVSLTMRYGFRTGFAASLGVLSTNVLLFSLSALGIGALILASATLFTLIKWVGAIYLAYLGIGMIVPLVRHFLGQRSTDVVSGPDDPTAPYPIRQLTGMQAFWQAFSLQAADPKNLAFFVAILPQFITPDAGVAVQMLVLGAVSIGIELPILVAYGAASAFSARLMGKRVIVWIEAVGGGVLVALAGALALSQRSP